MAEFMYDPDSLADALDALLSGADVPRDEILLQTAARVLNAPPLVMSPEATARIEMRVLETFRQLPPPASPFPYLPLLSGLIVILIAVGTIFAVSQNQSPAAIPLTTASSTFTATATATASLTFTPTPTPTATGTDTHSPTPSAAFTQTSQPAVVPGATLTPTPPPSATPPASTTPTFTSTPAINALPVGTDVNLIIEGPVTAINGNVVVIYDIEIIIDPDDPLLGIIQIDDTIRVEAHIDDGLVIAAVNIIFITVDVSVSESGEVWRDNGNCDNPPPPWAPANGWHRRCDAQPIGQGNGGSGGGMGDDDDDDD